MPRRLSRRQVLTSGAAAGGLVLTGGLGQAGASNEGDDEEQEEYEIWALDQGTDTGYIYTPNGGDGFELAEEIDFHELDGIIHPEGDDHDHGGGEIVPHMIDFSSDYEYAAIACTAGAQTLIFRTEDRELVAAFETGPGTHFAGFAPDDSFIQVDVIEEGTIVRIDADLENEEFEVTDELVVEEDPVFEQCAHHFEGSNPICHQYTESGYSYHTLGPEIDAAGVVIVDTETFELADVFLPSEVRANCGTIAHPTDSKFYLTAGAPSNHEPTGGVGEWYVVDTDEHVPITPEGDLAEDDFTHEDVARDSGGYDAHGFWFTPDGEELWVLNRETDDGLVVDPETDEVIDEIEDYGPAPDIMWASPDGEYMFVSLRGGEPVSGDPHAAEGETPGFSVLDIESREVVEIVEPDPETPESDFHAVGVRAINGDSGGVSQ